MFVLGLSDLRKEKYHCSSFTIVSSTSCNSKFLESLDFVLSNKSIFLSLSHSLSLVSLFFLSFLLQIVFSDTTLLKNKLGELFVAKKYALYL